MHQGKLGILWTCFCLRPRKLSNNAYICSLRHSLTAAALCRVGEVGWSREILGGVV